MTALLILNAVVNLCNVFLGKFLLFDFLFLICIVVETYIELFQHTWSTMATVLPLRPLLRALDNHSQRRWLPLRTDKVSLIFNRC